jgi:hypothetical protein
MCFGPLSHECPLLDLNLAELPSAGKFDCQPHEHLSGNFKGPCWGSFSDSACKRVCLGESSDNIDGFCEVFKCWCETSCTPEVVVAATSPIPA